MRAGAATLAALVSLWPTGARAEDVDHALIGARFPDAADVVVHGALGLALVLPHATVGARIGFGGGAGAELGYRNLAVFGHEGRVMLGWGTPIARGADSTVDIGLGLRGSFSSLALADGGLIGIQFSSLSLGNDLEVGHDLSFSWNRPGRAHLTASLGPTFTLGGLRYFGFDESQSFVYDPAIRAIDAAIQGEWALGEETTVFLRLEGTFLLGVETDEACQAARQEDCEQVAPFGFLPTAAVGLAWWAL